MKHPSDYFDGEGNFCLYKDPYRQSDNEDWSGLFGDDGNLTGEAVAWINKILNPKKPYKNPFKFNCDLVKCYHADQFASNTKGNYSTIYYWR